MNTYKYPYKGNKQKLTLSVDKDLVNEAKIQRINISRFLEENLKTVLRGYWARPDSNRGSSPRKGDVITARLRALLILINIIILKK